jgi:hypothetical protein
MGTRLKMMAAALPATWKSVSVETERYRHSSESSVRALFMRAYFRMVAVIVETSLHHVIMVYRMQEKNVT